MNGRFATTEYGVAMKNWYSVVAFVVILLLVVAPGAWAQSDITRPDRGEEVKKRGQTGFKFLSVSTNPRAAAMANTTTALSEGSSVSLLYNPASMAAMKSGFDAQWSNAQWISNIDYNAGSAAFRPGNGQYGVVGVSLVDVQYPTQIETIRADNDAGYSEIGSFSPTAFAIGLGYARSFSDRFSAGVQAKYVSQDLGSHAQRYDENDKLVNREFSKNTLAYDFGLLYRTGYKSLTLGMSARNFAPEITYVRESFELPLTMRIGFSMNVLDFTSVNPEMHALNVRTSFERPRDFSEQILVGGEYVFMNTLALRGGYGVPSEEQGLSLGAGLQTELSDIGVQFDYAYTSFGVFGTVNQLSLQIGL